MAGHYSIRPSLNSQVINLLNSYIEKNPVADMIPFKRYFEGDISYQRLTDRNERGDTDVIAISPTTLYDEDGEIADFCIAEIHLNNNSINLIYCVL